MDKLINEASCTRQC